MNVTALLFDLDGTVYRGEHEVPGASDFVHDALKSGIRCVYATNRSNRSTTTVSEHLNRFGIPARPDDILTSAEAAALFLKTGRVFVIGEPPLVETLERHGIQVSDKEPDTVLVSFDREFSYAKLEKAARLIRAGARFVATNRDACLKINDGLVPGTGSLVAAVATASGRQPLVVGKPEGRMMKLALDKFGLTADETIALGDNLETDIVSAAAADLKSVLMLTGISTREDAAAFPVAPTWIVKDFAALRALAGDWKTPLEKRL